MNKEKKIFNQAVENRGEISVELFILKYYFGYFFLPPLCFEVAKKQSLLNICNIQDDTFSLGIDIDVK